MIKANYSNARLALLEFRRRTEAYQHAVMVWQLCRRVWARWMDTAVLAGALDLPGYERTGAAYLACAWLPPKWDWVDPLKDAKAEIEQIAAGLKSRTQALAERGYDAEQVDAEIAADQARERTLGLSFGGRKPPSGCTPRAADDEDAAPEDADALPADPPMNLKSLAASRLAGRPWAIAPARLEGLLGNVAALSTGADLPPWLQDATRSPRLRGHRERHRRRAGAGPAGRPRRLADRVARRQRIRRHCRGAAARPPTIRRCAASSSRSTRPAARSAACSIWWTPSAPSGSGRPSRCGRSRPKRRCRPPTPSPLPPTGVYVTRTGEVGSVGVVAVHLDESGADAMAGLKWTLIHAGARKTDGNPHEPLSPRATADIQADVDHLYDHLVALVAANRGLSADAVRATEAADLPRRAGGQGRPRRSGRHRRAGHRRSGGGAGDEAHPRRPAREPHRPFANPHHPQGPSP